jgi:hypothetical protein
MTNPEMRFPLLLLLFSALPASSGDLTGIVKGPDGRVVSGATVAATPAAPNSLSDTSRAARIARTDAKGCYRLVGLPQGAYGATATFPGLGSGFQGKVQVPEVGEVRGVDFALGRDATTFQGRIRKPAGVAVEGLTVFASRTSEEDGDLFYGEVTGDGYRLSLSPGTYSIHLEAPGWEGASMDRTVTCPETNVDIPIFPIQGTLPELSNELKAMALEDQEVRKADIAHRNDKSIAEKWHAVDRKNQARMKEILKAHGWPGANLVGMKGSGAAWLLVQHAPSSFIKECLPLMKEAADRGELDWGLVALSIDRDLVNDGKKQIYGSQFKRNEKGEWEPYPIEDEAHVDERRSRVGLGSLAQYRKDLIRAYSPS